jgi:sugar (pentulose or hexulose) kinase
MLADTLNIKIYTINTAEGGALGSIILAMVGCKIYKDTATACKQIIRNNEVFTPNAKNHKYYLNKFAD